MYAYRSDVRRPRIRLNALRAHFIGVDTAQTEKRKNNIKRVLKQFVAVLRPVIFMQTVVF